MAKQTIQIADKPTVDEILALLEDAENGLASIKTLLGISADAASVEAVKSLLENGTYGLGALKAKADEINTNVDNTFNLVSNKGDDIINRLNNSTYGLNVIKTAITGRANESTATAVKALLEDTTYGLSALKTALTNYYNSLSSNGGSILSLLNNSTYGLSALKNHISLPNVSTGQIVISSNTTNSSTYTIKSGALTITGAGEITLLHPYFNQPTYASSNYLYLTDVTIDGKALGGLSSLEHPLGHEGQFEYECRTFHFKFNNSFSFKIKRTAIISSTKPSSTAVNIVSTLDYIAYLK